MHSAYHVETDEQSRILYCVQDDEDLRATDAEVLACRIYGMVADPVTPERIIDDGEPDRDNRVDASTLQNKNRVAHGGGSKNKNRTKPVRPLTGPQRIEKHIKLAKDTADDAYLGETETQRAERQLREKTAEMERADRSKGGRPRRGAEVEVRASVRLAPAIDASIKADYGTLKNFVEQKYEEEFGNAA